jgi:hypothetical protein
VEERGWKYQTRFFMMILGSMQSLALGLSELEKSETSESELDDELECNINAAVVEVGDSLDGGTGGVVFSAQ